MILNYDNGIDRKLSDFYSQEVLDSINKDVLGYLAINITSQKDSDIGFKVYYNENYSKNELSNYEHYPIVKYLLEKDMLRGFESVNDKANSEYKRFNVRVKNCTNKNMLELFDWLEKNVKFFPKYKDEILKLSTMRDTKLEDHDYDSFYFMGFGYRENDVELLKCYWMNDTPETPDFNDEYYINFIKDSGVKGLQEILPIATELLESCGGHFLLEGIDYNAECSKRHKIYILSEDYSMKLYDNIIQVFQNNDSIKNQLCQVRDWHEVHPEFYCDGLGVGKDCEGNLILNLYYTFKDEWQLQNF